MIISAQDLGRTRLCAARDCANDAESGWALCSSCERRRARGHPIPLHVTPERLPDTLRCCSCDTFKPDDDFNHQNNPKSRFRRNRNSECRQCQADRKRLHRLLHPTTTTRCQATNTGQRDRNDKRAGQPCRGYASHGSAYCSVHLRKSQANAPVETRKTGA